ncbi:hypothetical protein F3Y22_tig00110264pilonHSYRG00106 [Hibiscus syriacus]|uniref:RNase H type-1 domain-containing protein n=1 Tax=Hibiscus syriacus TaxID=106335 RepID=A0A6A3B9C4_HIBSY|nr:hypothetical protein F3Y22_tig00110264pilonHSYRG00106 [Hibiscus syriacus]
MTWQFLYQPTSLWVKAFKVVYGVHGDVISFVSNPSLKTTSWSHNWRSLVFGLKDLASGMMHKIGNGEDTLFWQDNWLGELIYRCLNVDPTLVDDLTRVFDFITRDFEWDTNKENLAMSRNSHASLIHFAVQFGTFGKNVAREFFNLQLNNGGASQGNLGVAGSGVLFRDKNGAWVMDYTAHLGTYTSVAAEVDAQLALYLINNCDSPSHPLGFLIEDIRSFKARNWILTFQHIHRKGNLCADILSKLGCSLEDDLVIFSSPPAEVSRMLEADSRGLFFPRGFSLQ